MQLGEALARRDVLGIRHSALKSIIDATTKAQARYSRSEIRIVRTVDVAALRKSADDAARERRELASTVRPRTVIEHRARRTTSMLSLRRGEGG